MKHINYRDQQATLTEFTLISWQGKNTTELVTCDFLKSITSLVFGISLTQMNANTRLGANVAFARQIAMYIAHVRLTLTLSDVGRVFGRDRTTVGHACRLVEDRRDDPDIDFLVECVERSVDEWQALAGKFPGN